MLKTRYAPPRITALFLGWQNPNKHKHNMIRSSISTFALSILALSAFSQYGTFDAAKAKTVANTELIVVLESGNSVLNAALKTAVEQFWSVGDYSFSTTGDLGASGFLADKTYLVHNVVTDPVTFKMHYFSLVQGWKMKKSQSVQTDGKALKGIPEDQVLASILFDPEAMNAESSPMAGIYVKHLQDYIDQVSNGKIMDKTSADRLYKNRNRHIKEGELRMIKEHVDKTFPEDESAVMEVFPHPYRIKNKEVVMQVVSAPDREVNITDVVLTGEYKTRHCFKRVFNTATGELMYQADEPSLHGKKEGFLIDDMKTIARSR